MPRINPYNFVALRNLAPNRESGYPGRERLQAEGYSGKLWCTLTALTPLLTLDQQKGSKEDLSALIGIAIKNKNKDPLQIRIFKFLRNSQDIPIISGASLKGMIRSVYEALTDSCLTLAATSGMSQRQGQSEPYHYAATQYSHSLCCQPEKLCPACRLFGAIEGEDLHCQGRVACSDARLTTGELQSRRRYLKELSGPKPHHYPTYAAGTPKGLGSPIAGRKFYYHHASGADFFVPEGELQTFFTNQGNSTGEKVARAIGVDEVAAKDAVFTFQVYLDNLSAPELGDVLLALELSAGLAHKIGLGKSLGLGSCRIVVDREKSALTKPRDRYEDWQAAPNPDWYQLKSGPENLPPDFIELLRLNKAEDGEIGYPHFRDYPSQPIDARGVFGGRAVVGGNPPVALAEPGEPPAGLRPGELAARLQEIDGDWLKFVLHPSGEEVERPRRSCQTPKHLDVGGWFILTGTNASRRYRPPKA